MPDIALQCTCCGYMLTFPEDAAVRICPACATPNARPMVEDNALDMLRHAIRQRLGCDFANAERSYQQVLLDYPDAHEALWGRLLCHYGVEYVEDPATHRLMPTVHTVRRKPMQTQPEFRDACAFAPDDVRVRYEEEAAYIDDAQVAIRLAAASCPPYDVFLCHKTTRPGTGEKTADYERALQLYYYLREQGLRPFFAPQSLVGLAGADYEAGIYHAIDTAKVMLVLCSQKDYLTSAWVRSEWSRYIERIDDGADKTLVPLLYDHFSPMQLPPEFRFRRIQGFPMGELTSTERLMEMLREKVGKAVVAQQVAPMPAPKPEAAPIHGLADEAKSIEAEATKTSRERLDERSVQANATMTAPIAPSATKAKPEAEAVQELVKTSGVQEFAGTKANASGEGMLTRRILTPAIRNAKVGEHIYYGRYLQENGKKKPISWLVLAREENRMLVISRDALEFMCYNMADADTTWADCTLRHWLNGEFFSQIFTREEQAAIPAVMVRAEKNPFYAVTAGAEATDRIFLLSRTEAKRYFATNTARICKTAETMSLLGRWNPLATCEWWLRTPGEKQNRVAFVLKDGSIRDRGCSAHNTAGVRPAMWLDLNM